MKQYKLGEMEQKFANLIWDKAPLTSRELTVLAEDEFQWKRTTTYTMLKRLCDRGIFENDKGRVSILMTKNQFMAEQGEEFLNETFGGSLPNFIASFTRKNRLSTSEIEQIQKLIDEHKEIE